MNGDGLFGTLPARAEGEHDVVGRERRAVVPFDALAELELPGRVVDGLPALGEAWNEVLLLVVLDQPLEHMAEKRIVRRQIVVVRIHGRRLGRKTDAQILRQRLAE